MNFNQDYIPQALRTESNIAPLTIDPDVLKGVLGLAIASGNLADLIKKNVAYGKPINQEAWTENLNDVVKHATDVARLGDVANLVDATEPQTTNTRIFHGIFGLFTEATELMEAFQKGYNNGGQFDYVNIQEECSDSNWYQAILIDEMKADFDQMNERVLAKLRARYPEKFSSDDAINRNLEVERKILEGK